LFFQLCSHPAGLPGDAEQDARIVFSEFAAAEDAAQPHHHVVEFFGFAESGFKHHVAPRVEESFARGTRGFRRAFAGSFIGGAGCEQKEFVATNHDGVREVERSIDLTRWNVDDVGADGEFFVEEAFVLPSENESGFVVHGGIYNDRGDFARQEGVVTVHAGTRAGARHNGSVGDRLFQSLENLAGVEEVTGVAGQSPGLLPVEPVVRGDKCEIGDAHIHQNPADGADVSSGFRVDEYGAYVFEWIHK